jgi:hypothetical protein
MVDVGFRMEDAGGREKAFNFMPSSLYPASSILNDLCIAGVFF